MLTGTTPPRSMPFAWTAAFLYGTGFGERITDIVPPGSRG